VVFFICLLVAVFYVLWPREWTFSVSASTILRNQRRAPQGLEVHHAFLATMIEGHHDRNQRVLNTLMRAFRFGCAALALEILAWLLPF
jgi:hypothetical protein